MDDQRTDRESGGISEGVKLRIAWVFAILMVMFGTYGAVGASNYLHNDIGKRHLDTNWPALIVYSMLAIVGGIATVYIKLRFWRIRGKK